MSRTIYAKPLTREGFAPFGDVIDKSGVDDRIPINNGHARRLPPLGEAVSHGQGSKVAISIVEGDPYHCPLSLEFVERHPLGSQAFIPLSPQPFLVIVCQDEAGVPGAPQAFITSPYQGVNYHPNIWHGVLTPLDASQDFLVIDRLGEGSNLEEHKFDRPWAIELSPTA